MKQEFKVVMLTLVAQGVIISGVILIVFLIFSPDKFNQERWLNNPSKRVDMVDNLVSDGRLKGKTKIEIIDLLGIQDKDAYFIEPNNLVYYLGDERGFISIDSEWLIIWFDDKEKVLDYEIRTD